MKNIVICDEFSAHVSELFIRVLGYEYFENSALNKLLYKLKIFNRFFEILIIWVSNEIVQYEIKYQI